MGTRAPLRELWGTQPSQVPGPPPSASCVQLGPRPEETQHQRLGGGPRSPASSLRAALGFPHTDPGPCDLLDCDMGECPSLGTSR